MESWRQNYDELTNFIQQHPTIQISTTVMAIFDDVRPEFYRLFDRVRAAYVKDKYPSLADAYQLSENFLAAKDQTLVSLGLKEIDASPELGAFLKEPVEGLMRKLFEPLFGLLQGQTSLEDFDKSSVEIIRSAAKTYSQQGYTHWTTLSMMRMLNPDSAQIVPVADQTTEPELTSADTRPGWYTEEIPKLKAAERLSLDFSLHIPFLVPRIIIHSEIQDRFTCISTSFHEVYRKAKDLSQRLEWYSLEVIHTEFGKGNLWPDIALTTGSTCEELRVAADYINVARPDIIVDVMESSDWYETGGLESVKRHKKILNPRFGAFVVCRHPVPRAALDEIHPPEQQEIVASLSFEGTDQSPTIIASAPVVAREPCRDIHLLNVNFDAGALEPILDMLRRQNDKN